MSKFTHLHLHSEFSLLDGLNKIPALAKRIKALGMDSVALTDHGNMFGALEFYIAMKQEGINPIIGMEAYIHNGDELNDKSTKARFHLCLYAKNLTGYKNLMYLSSQAYLQGFYYYPRINKKLLRAHSDGLVCSAACLQGEINFHLNTHNERNVRFGAKGYEVAKEVALEYKDIFGEDFYLEIMRHGIADQFFIDEQILRLSKEIGIKVIATNDTHYGLQADADSQNIAFRIAMGKDKGLRHIVKEFYVKSPEQMAELFLDIPEALQNTQEIAQKCRLDIPLKNTQIINKHTNEILLENSPATPPTFKNTNQYAQNDGVDKILGIDLEEIDDSVYLAYKCREGLEERLKNVESSKHHIYKERLEHEIQVITQMKFPGYMLIVWDFVNFAKKQGIPVGTGRGSAAGSLVVYSLKITDIDPIKYDLLFERFLNSERVSMPDIDMDFCQRRRGEVIEYVISTYGEHNVAQVITFGSLKARGVIRDVARALDMPYNEADNFAKLIPKELNITLTKYVDKSGEQKEGAWEKEPKIRELVEQNAKAKEVWECALALEGLKRNPGTHAAAIVIDSNDELWHKIPLYTNEKTQGAVTQYSMDYLEKVDLIKFDFLGLKTLTVVDDTLKLIKKRYGKDIDLSTLDMEDKQVYEMIGSGETLGLFQMESNGMQGVARRLKPSTFDDIGAMIALYRPGPMDSISEFIDRKHGITKVTYMFPALEPILKPTYGAIVYQEQVMQIVQKIGGFSLGGADLVRRAMGKKKVDEMNRLKAQFADGAQAQGYERAKAEELWELVAKFAGYGFNKSHAYAYAALTYQTAFLKTYYKHEFMAAMLTSETSKIESVGKYIDEVRSMGIEVLAPHINYSQNDFSVEEFDGVKKIVFGLGAIKGLGSAPAENIIQEREANGEYKDLADFISRVDFAKLTKRSLEPLIKGGSLDGLQFSRRAMLERIDEICEAGRNNDKVKKEMCGSTSLFGEQDESFFRGVHLEISDMPEYDASTLLGYEFECMGIYIGGHPLDKFKDQIASMSGVAKCSEIENLKLGSQCLLVGKVEKLERKISKKGSPYGVVHFLDFSGALSFMVFSKQFAQLEELQSVIESGEPIVFKCKIEDNEEKRTVRVMESGTLQSAKKYKVQLETDVPSNEGNASNESAEDSQWGQLANSEIDICAPLVLMFDESADLAVLAKIKESLPECSGERELRVALQSEQKTYTFVSGLRVDSKIKEKFPDLHWAG
ncbi:DNA polymerase III subunit alpha [Helicobacter sp. 23-1046]